MSDNNINKSIEDKILGLFSKPLVITRGAWQTSQRYVELFGDLVNNRNIEFFVYLCADRQNTVSKIYCPKQICTAAEVIPESIPRNLLDSGFRPVSLCHYHHTYGIRESSDDVASHFGFLRRFASVNGMLVHREEDLFGGDVEVTEKSHKIIITNAGRTKYLRGTLLRDEPQQLRNMLPSIREGLPAVLIEYGYSVIFDAEFRYSAQLMLREVCNECLIPYGLRRDFVNTLVKTYGASVLELEAVFKSNGFYGGGAYGPGNFSKLLASIGLSDRVYASCILSDKIEVNVVGNDAPMSDLEIKKDILEKVDNINKIKS
ncbi:MAG: hypothetical protein HY438_02440 [DPANN group archaeon]|nr:hypothetical protein [DPANN group archaeon]